MNQVKILIIDDDVTLIELLSDHLNTAGYYPVAARDGHSGLVRAAEDSPDLVVLDVMMPGLDGWEVCRRLREFSPVPIIMLTAKDQEVDKLRGFRLGVDDYVTKPFSFAELTARVSAILARARGPSSPGKRLASGNLLIDFDQRRVMIGEGYIELTKKEYHLLEVLARHTGRTVPTETLLIEVWGPEYAGEITHVKHYIWSLRKKIEADPGDPQHIITERGFGYRFE